MRLQYLKLDWIGLDWIGLDWLGLLIVGCRGQGAGRGGGSWGKRREEEGSCTSCRLAARLKNIDTLTVVRMIEQYDS